MRPYDVDDVDGGDELLVSGAVEWMRSRLSLEEEEAWLSAQTAA